MSELNLRDLAGFKGALRSFAILRFRSGDDPTKTHVETNLNFYFVDTPEQLDLLIHYLCVLEGVNYSHLVFVHPMACSNNQVGYELMFETVEELYDHFQVILDSQNLPLKEYNEAVGASITRVIRRRVEEQKHGRV